MLDEFDSLLDTTNIIISYPIPSFSQDMIPSEGSDYTVLAIRCNRDLWQCSLQYVINIKSYIVDNCAITQHCLQLLAIRSDPTIFYWTIPKSVAEIIRRNVLQWSDNFYSQGILEVSVYPKQSLSTSDEIIIGSLAFICDRESTTMEPMQNSTSHFKAVRFQDKDIIKGKDIIKLKSWAEQMDREVCCSVCLRKTEDSKTLSTCHHEFCGDCMKDLLQKDKSIFKKEYPFCQAIFKEENQDYHTASSPSSMQLEIPTTQLGSSMDGLAESLEKELTCPICFNLFKEPKVLPCQHNFCGDCMEGLLQRNERVHKLQCPICQDPFKQEDIKKSFQMRRD